MLELVMKVGRAGRASGCAPVLTDARCRREGMLPSLVVRNALPESMRRPGAGCRARSARREAGSRQLIKKDGNRCQLCNKYPGYIMCRYNVAGGTCYDCGRLLKFCAEAAGLSMSRILL